MSELFLRQRDIFLGTPLSETEVAVAGVGAVGHNVARLLSFLGPKAIHVYDMDTVEPENYSLQGYREKYMGMSKVDAVADSYDGITPHFGELDSSSIMEGTVLFMCVDTMKARREIMETRNSFQAVFDTRMSSNTARVIAYPPFTWKEYWFEDDQSSPEPCSSRGCLYGADACACMAVNQFAENVKGRLQLPSDRQLCLMGLEMLDLQEAATVSL